MSNVTEYGSMGHGTCHDILSHSGCGYREAYLLEITVGIDMLTQLLLIFVAG